MNHINPIELYSESLPSPTSRYVLYRELIAANSWCDLLKWDEATGVRYIRYLESKGLSPSSIKTKAERISRYFNWLLETGRWKKSNPINKRLIPKFRDERPPQALTAEETKLFLKQIPQATWIGCRDKVAATLMIANGLRIGSVCNIMWSDLEIKSGEMFLHLKSKGNVLSSRQLRADVANQIKKLYFKTYGEHL